MPPPVVVIFYMTIEELVELIESHGLNSAFFSRYLLQQLAWGVENRAWHSYAIINEIKVIEQGGRTSTKPARSFRAWWLDGFSYKHWFEARFLAQNIANH